MHTSNQGFAHTFKFSAVHIMYSLLWMFPSLCSLPVFSLPSFPGRSSQWCLWLTRVPSSPSLCIPFPPPPFPLFPALFPYWRLCSRSLSLLTIMFPPSFPIFDYVPSPFPYFRLCPWHSCNLCIKYLSKQTGQLLSMHKIMFQIPTLFLMQDSPLKRWVLEPSEKMGARALLKDECSSPLKRWVLEPS